ncbi:MULTISPECIES: sporulation delaying protein family toxin [unclassified Streptomyces]|uniref:sporulation delaying protein family toxin n=1 Tax=unclassified Streptomyces TaxID=2593676 RepID=UPI000CD4D7FA|nr:MULTISPECIES: sporulation delaying protein family toxin [unclassified Streptomyces]
MKKSHRLIAVVAAAALLGTGAATAGAASSAGGHGSPAVTTPLTDATADGEALFAGIFFGQGQIGESLKSQLKYSDPEGQLEANKSAEAVDYVASLQAAMAESSPGFFADFSTRVRSGDPRQVEAALNDAGKLLEEGAQIVGADLPDGTGQAVFVFNIAVLVNVGVGVNVAAIAVAAAVVEVQMWSVIEIQSDLDRERAVATLTKVLATI